MVCKNFKCFLTFLTISIFTLTSGCASQNPELKKQSQVKYDIGVMYLNKGDFSNAILNLSTAQRFNSKDPYIYNALGLSYYGENMIDQAEDAYKKAIALKKDFSDAHNNLGVLYLHESKWDSAIKQFKETLKNPLYMSPQIAWVNLGWAYYKKGNLKQSKGAYMNALNIATDMPAAHNNLGLVYLKENKLKRAEAEFKTAIHYFAGYSEAYLYLGIVYMREHNDTEAKKQFEAVLKLAPDSTFSEDARRYLKIIK
ncbi:MAG: tetratricopeptide repeat protein [Deltaproteobacteria bacterium]|nr:tetratricopeptide repeat protein [Deltaproteobacteria bacterium]